MTESCVRCGIEVDPNDCYGIAGISQPEIADDPPIENTVVACRIEHVASWAVRGGQWPPWNNWPSRAERVQPNGQCESCGDASESEERLVVVRFRDDRVTTYEFCSLEHLKSWSLAGGPWARPAADARV
jgi:hypothetical protein